MQCKPEKTEKQFYDRERERLTLFLPLQWAAEMTR